MDNNPVVVMTLKDLTNFVHDRERTAQIKVLKDIKPFGNGTRIQAMITKIKKGTYGKKVKKSNSPREFQLTVRNVPQRGEFADLEQYMVTEA